MTKFEDISLDDLAKQMQEQIEDCNKCPIINFCCDAMDFETDDCFDVWKKYLQQEVNDENYSLGAKN